MGCLSFAPQIRFRQIRATSADPFLGPPFWTPSFWTPLDHGVRSSDAGLCPEAEAGKEKPGDDAEITENTGPVSGEPIQRHGEIITHSGLHFPLVDMATTVALQP